MPADIIVRIGAAADRSVDTVFSDIEKRAQRAFGAARRQSTEFSAGTSADARNASAAQRAADAQQAAATRARVNAQMAAERDRFREASRLNRQIHAEQAKTERAMALQAAKSARERTAAKLSEIAQQEKAERDYQARLVRMNIQAAREKNRATRASERERIRDQYRAEREIDRFATRTSHRATRFFFPRPEGALGYTKRVAGDLMRGAGVDFSLAGGVTRAREREAAGMGLAQQERIATGATIGGRAWSELSRTEGEKLSIESEKVTELIRAFTGKTGAFDDIKSMIGDLGAMAVASGSDLGQMGDAAGFVYNQLKGLPNAGATTIEVLRGIIGQTAVGSVEMQDFATQMGRIAANAQKFKGDAGENIKKMAALAQLAVASGGATGAADAARSVAAFANTFGKEARISAFAKQGVNLFEDQTTRVGKRGKIIASGTIMRDPLDIIKDSIEKTQGDIPKLASMFADTLGRKPVTALANAWAKAGGSKKGINPMTGQSYGMDAIDAEFSQYMKAQMTVDVQKQNIGAYKETTGAKAQAFQAQLDKITESLAGKLLPALENLAPTALELAETFSKAIQWAAGNPWEAVMVLLGASVARAATESLGRMLLERGLTAVAGMGGRGAAGAAVSAVGAATQATGGGLLARGGAAIGGALGTGGPLGAMGTAMNAAGVIGLGAATFMVTSAIIESASTTLQSEEKKTVTSANDVFQQFAKDYASAKSPEEQANAWKRARFDLGEIEGRRGLTERLFGESPVNRTLDAMKEFAARSDATKEKAATAAQFQQATGQSMQPTEIAAVVARELTGALSKGIPVKLTNPDDIKFSSMVGTPASAGGLPTFSQQ